MVRQTLELSHKSLLEETVRAGNVDPSRLLHTHRLDAIWALSRGWLLQNGYPIDNDQRLAVTDWLTANYNAIDPIGDLFRFANSKVEAYSRQKTYDRVGIYLGSLVPYFDKTFGLLTHWSAVLSNQKAKNEDPGYESAWDPYDYPKIAECNWRW